LICLFINTILQPLIKPVNSKAGKRGGTDLCAVLMSLGKSLMADVICLAWTKS
jgi:hypothetical protein